MAKRKGPSPIGVDLQQNSAKMIQFCHGPNGPALGACASVSFDDSLIQIEDRQTQPIVAALRQALGRGDFRGCDAVITLPAKKVDVRTLTLPGAEAELEKMMKWEAESYLHYDVKDACIDYVKLGDVSAGNEKRSEVLVAAAGRPYLYALLDLLDRAGLKTQAVDIMPMALCRLARYLGEHVAESSVSIIDIGRTASLTVILDKGSLRLTRNIACGGEEFTTRIKSNLDILPEEAELLKIEYGAGAPKQGSSFGADHELVTKTEVAGAIHEILRHQLEEMAAELQKLFRYFSTQSKGAQVARGYLCGGGSKLKGLPDFLTQHTGTRMEMLPALATLFPGKCAKDAPASGGPDACGPEFAVAAGLALRDSADDR